MGPPADVLSQYPSELLAADCEYQSDAGGLSGARLWRLRASRGDWCLKAHPVATTSAEQLVFGHRLMHIARDMGLHFITAVLPTRAGQTHVASGGWLWDVTTWQPGEAPADARDNQLAAA